MKSAFVKRAHTLGIDPTFSEILAELLISRSVRVQVTGRPKDLNGKKALVVGGSGRMGAWLCRRLSNRGATVQVWDPRGRIEGYENVESLKNAARTADIIVLSSPLGVCPEELDAVIDASPSGLVFDVCSVKAHISKRLRKAAKSGFKITSVHPMFGPNVATPKGRNVVICDCGNRKANEEAARLFSSAGANVIEISLEEHDRMMAYVLGLAHACTLLFAGTLSVSGTKLRDFAPVTGPSFEKLLDSAKELSKESVRVYHDIQALNPNTRRMFAQLKEVLESTKSASLDIEPAKFRKIIESSKEYLEVN